MYSSVRRGAVQTLGCRYAKPDQMSLLEGTRINCAPVDLQRIESFYFQFHKVQFRARICRTKLRAPSTFNSTRSNSEGGLRQERVRRKVLSIPQGPIQSPSSTNDGDGNYSFQFHKVQFRGEGEAVAKRNLPPFQFHKVQFRGNVRRISAILLDPFQFHKVQFRGVAHGGYIEITSDFQFHKVQFRAHYNYRGAILRDFQFHKVQFRGKRSFSTPCTISLSIPQGPIQSPSRPAPLTEDELSIPQGPIQSNLAPHLT